MTPLFHNPLRLQEYGKEKWFLTENFSYTTLHFGQPRKFTVPALVFPTDLASIPHILRPIIRRGGTHKAAVIHDYLTYRNPKFKERGMDCITRSDVDKIFYEALLTDGVPPLKAWMMYQAVRAFSFVAKR